MRLMSSVLLIAALVAALVSVPASASVGPKNLVTGQGTLVDAQTMAANRSFSLTQLSNQGAYGLLMVYVSLTDANNSITNLRMSCTTSRDGNTTDFDLVVCTTASGVCTSNLARWDFDPSGVTSPKRWLWRVDVEGMEDVECTFTPTGGAAADTLTVTGALAVKGG